MPPPARPAGGSGYGAATARYASHLGAGGPHTTGKDGRDGSKRMRTGRNGWVDTSAGSNAHKPCVFFIQGHCKNGSKCGYLHGDSPLPCHMFNTRAGCKFGDKCAFRHADGGRFSRARQHAAPATIVNPFAVHAENCGCETCHPGPAEDGEVVDGGAGEEGEEGEASEKASEEKPNSFVAYAGERRKTAEEAAERDAVLAMCSNVDASEALRGAWAPFAEAAMRAASAGDGDKYGGWGRR